MNLKVDMIYGESKTTKTSRLGDAAEYYFKKTGKPARGVFSDTGGYDAIQKLVDEGIVIPFILSPERGATLLEDMDRLSQGWWPADPSDPKAKLVKGPLDSISVMLFDGATSWCELMAYYHERSVKFSQQGDNIMMVPTNVRVPEMPKDSFVKSGDFGFRFLGRSDYMGVQGAITSFIRNTAFLAVPAIWTAVEAKSADEFSKPCYGPDFFGNKLTGKCGKWFGNLLHLDQIATKQTVDVGGKKIEVTKASPFLFTTPHIDPDDPYKIPYMAGTRVDKSLWDKVPPVMEPRLDKFYELIDSLMKQAKGAGK